MINYRQDRKKIEQVFRQSSDILALDLVAFGKSAVLVYIDGMTDKELIDRNVIEPLKKCKIVFKDNHCKKEENEIIDIQKLQQKCELAQEVGQDVLITENNFVECDCSEINADLINKVIFLSDPIKVVPNFDEFVECIADGDIGFLIDGANEYFIFSLKNYKIRGITEPPVSTVLRGPREGFVEDMKINMTMIRRRFRTPNLVFEMTKAGKYSATNIAIAYIDGIADKNIVKEIKNRIEKINIDGIIDSSYIAKLIADNKYSLFTQVGRAEKPDIVAGKMLEGRVAIICDGSPTVLTLPFVMYEHFQSSEDYYIKSYRATLTRVLRVFAMIIAIALPGVYVALQEFQYQMLPLKLLIVIMNSIYGVPLTPMYEMLVLLFIFEILNETSIRMPRYVGTALSIVGAIVLGEAAVNAGLMSIPSLLVTALSTIGLYSVPDEVNAGSILRILFVVVSGTLGIFGLVMASIMLFAYLVSLQNFGTGYMTPFSPMIINDMQDTLIKRNINNMTKRPYSIPTQNRTRLKNDK